MSVMEAIPAGIRCRNYSGSATAALSYEAEALTALNGAGSVALSGASGGTAVSSTAFPGDVWVPMLYTNLTAGAAPLTHVGSYRAWARCFASAATPQFQLQWGVGGISVPVTNDPVRLPGTASFYLLDLGPVNIQAPPTGPTQWFGVIQTQVDNTNDHVAIDRLYFQPLDEAAGKLQYVPVPPASSVAATGNATVGADNSGTGTLTWAGTANISNPSSYATAIGPGTTHYLFATGFGFAIPTGATIKGISPSLKRQASAASSVLDAGVFLLKAGAVAGTTRAAAGYWPTAPSANSYGGPTDLWGTTWTPAQVNASNFGIALSAQIVTSQNAYLHGRVAITVYYTLAGGLTVAADAVIYASKTVELRTEGMFRSDSGGTIYAPVSQVTGDLPRLPPSGLEGRPIQIFVKPTRGDLDTLPDGGLDGLSVTPKIRPSYLFRP